MPRIVYPYFFKKLCQDISSSYRKGDRYLSIREIAAKFDVSVQTAQKGVNELAQKGVLLPKKRSGIFVLRNKCDDTLHNKQLLVLSRINNPLFYQPFLDGVIERTADTGIQTHFRVNTFKQTTSLAFGEYLCEQGVDGIITLNFDSSSALPFYHVLREKHDIISDIIIDELPLLPSVQTNNYKHAFQAGRMMINKDLSRFYVFGSYPEKNKRFIGFNDAVKGQAKKVKYVRLSETDSAAIAMGILSNMDASTGIFLSDYTAVHFIVSLCSRFHIDFAPYSVIAYDGEGDRLIYPGVPAIPCVGPSFKQIGYELCDAMITKWEEGQFSTPLQRKL
jgi:DNA-binding LacI/PurR family transcriptional regulator